VRKIGQSSPLAGESNTITVTIQTNWNLAATDSSVVTISGLTNAPDTSSLALTSVGNSGADLFSDGATQGKGALSSGTLRLTVHTGKTVQAGTQYAFSFTITNLPSAQNSLLVSIAASGTAQFSLAAMIYFPTLTPTIVFTNPNEFEVRFTPDATYTGYNLWMRDDNFFDFDDMVLGREVTLTTGAYPESLTQTYSCLSVSDSGYALFVSCLV
jgi:hypothetical protein